MGSAIRPFYPLKPKLICLGCIVFYIVINLNFFLEENVPQIAPKHRYNLDPFRDRWRKLQFSGVGDIHLYSAFLDDRNRKDPVVKINAAVNLAFGVEHRDLFR